MNGAILGDIWGSVFETIPKFPRRLFMTPTDDTFLTCACYEFMNSLSLDESTSPQLHFDSIYEKAALSLKKWGKLFPEPGAFSTGFLNWSQADGIEYKVASTNGCLMRQSPIALYSSIQNLGLENCIELSRIFCFPTHKAEESFLASKQHITILYLLLNEKLTKEDLLAHYPNLIFPLDHWQNLSLTVKNNFIWKASDSLGIALSSIYYSSSWEEMMRFLISISGDVDTYAAIAGPLAQIIYGVPKDIDKLNNVLFSLNDVRFTKIKSIYIVMNHDFKLFKNKYQTLII